MRAGQWCPSAVREKRLHYVTIIIIIVLLQLKLSSLEFHPLLPFLVAAIINSWYYSNNFNVTFQDHRV